MTDNTEAPKLENPDTDVLRVPLAQEEVRVGKRQVTTGTVQVRTVVDVFQEVEEASLNEEIVEVTRVPIDRVVDDVPIVRTEDDLTIVPIVEEVAVVVKRLVLKEEIHIRRRLRTNAVEIPVELRRERAVIERTPGERMPADGGTDDEST